MSTLRGIELKPILLKNAILITPSRKLSGGGLFISAGKIDQVFPTSEEVTRFENKLKAENATFQTIDLCGDYLSPGFIDIHCHGGGGFDFMDATTEAFIGAGRMHLAHGTTCLFPTTLASSTESLKRAIEAFRSVKGVDGVPEYPGLHLEGPYFSMAQRGAQDPSYLRDPNPQDYDPFFAYAKDIARWTLAPELPGALEMGRELIRRGILPAIGHSNATYEEVAQAFEEGFTLVTHLYSGMSMVHRKKGYRFAGVVESAYLIDAMAVEVIADGCHLPASLLKLICKIKTPQTICLVTDAMRAAGLPEGVYALGSQMDGQKAIVRDGVAWTLDGEAFAGSVATTERLLKTMVTLAGVSIESAVTMLTSTPAKVMKIDGRKGSLLPGMDADLVAFTPGFLVKAVVLKGKVEKCEYR